MDPNNPFLSPDGPAPLNNSAASSQSGQANGAFTALIVVFVIAVFLGWIRFHL